MNTTDLRDLLAEQADSVTANVSGHDQLDGALSRARTYRRRRFAAVGAAAVTIAVVAVGSNLVSVPTAGDPEPATPDVNMNLPTYAHGGFLIGEKTISLPSTESTITVTPESTPILLSAKCDTALQVTVRYGEGNINGSPCGDRARWFGEWDPEVGNGVWDIELGEPVTLDVTVEAFIEDTRDSELPETGTVRLGVYEAVPWDEYVFPERPEKLLDRDEMFGGGAPQGSREIIEPAEIPNEPVTFQFEGDAFELEIRAQTPGIMRVLIDGEETAVEHFWDYQGIPFVFGSTQTQMSDVPTRGYEPYGDPVEVTLVPEGFTGEWRALLTECEIPADGSLGCPASQ